MLCRIPSSLVEGAPIINIESLADLFNPHKHSLWRGELHTTGYMRVSEVIKALKALYSRENVSNPEFIRTFFPVNRFAQHPHVTTIFHDFIARIPDEYLYALNWLHVQAYSSTALKVYRIRGNNYSRDTIFEYSLDFDDRSFTNGEEAALWFTAKAREFNTTAMANPDRGWSNSIHNGSMPIGSAYSMMVTGRKYISDGRTSYTAYSLDNILSNTSNATINAEGTGGQFSVPIRVSIPIDYTNRARLYNIFSYTTDVTTLLHGKRKLPSEGTPVYIGVELELATDYSIEQLINASKELFFVAKQDSSITGRKPNKMELVTVPGSFKYIKKQYAHWFNNLDYQRFDCTNETNNGMHVHIDRRSFDDDYHIRNFCWFINNPANTPFIVAVSDRGSLSAMQTYCPIYNFPPQYTRTQSFKASHRLIENSRGATHLKGGWAGGKTLEVRIFRGIVSYAAIVKNLEFVESVFHFTQSLRSYREMTLSSYINWLFSQPANRFTILKKFLEQQDIAKFLVAAEVKDIIFNENDPDKIVQILAKSGLTLNNNHISYLNKGKKRTFVLDKTTGVVSVTKSNLFKLADLDISLAQRITQPTRAA